MTDTGTTHEAVFGCEAWITIDKNRFEPGETVNAVLHWGHNMRPGVLSVADDFSFFLTDPMGNCTEIVSLKGKGENYHMAFQVEAVGSYTLTGISENTYSYDENGRYFKCTQNAIPDIRGAVSCLQTSSACFFVGDCKVAVPKASRTRMLFVPEKWEIPDFYKLISLYLKRDLTPVPYAPVTMVFCNGDGYLERELHTDEFGNVFFVPYMAGKYCLINKTSLEEAVPGVYDFKSIITTFSFTLSGKGRTRSRSKRQANYNAGLSV